MPRQVNHFVCLQIGSLPIFVKYLFIGETEHYAGEEKEEEEESYYRSVSAA